MGQRGLGSSAACAPGQARSAAMKPTAGQEIPWPPGETLAARGCSSPHQYAPPGSCPAPRAATKRTPGQEIPWPGVQILAARAAPHTAASAPAEEVVRRACTATIVTTNDSTPHTARIARCPPTGTDVI